MPCSLRTQHETTLLARVAQIRFTYQTTCHPQLLSSYPRVPVPDARAALSLKQATSFAGIKLLAQVARVRAYLPRLAQTELCDRHCCTRQSSQPYRYAALIQTCLERAETPRSTEPYREQRSLHDTVATMPPAKKVVPEDSRSDASTVRERQIAAAAHARKSKQNAAAAAAATRDNGSALKELAAISAEAGNAAQAPGVSPTVILGLLQ